MLTRRFSALGLGAVATAALLWAAMPAAAQRGHGGGHGGGYHGGGHVGGWGGHYGGWGGHYGGWGHHGGWGWGGYYGWGYPSYSYYSYPSYDYYNNYYVQPYVYSVPTYSYPSYDTYTYSNPAVPATTYEGAEESSIATEASNAAQLNIRVPDAKAQVWIEGQKTNQQGTFRQFVSPPLDPNRDYTYHITARWQQNGREMEQTKDFAVHAGDRLTVDFRNATASNTQQLNQTPRTTTPTTTSGSNPPPPPPLDSSNTTTAPANPSGTVPQTPAQPSNTASPTTTPVNPTGTVPQTPAPPANNSNRGPAVP